MHIFMDVMARNQRRRALLGADEIDQEERENSGECQPRENFADGNWNRPGCGGMDKAVHVLPYKVSHVRAPLGKGSPRECGEDAGKPHPRGRRIVCQRGESLGGGCAQIAGGRGVPPLAPGGRKDCIAYGRPSARRRRRGIDHGRLGRGISHLTDPNAMDLRSGVIRDSRRSNSASAGDRLWVTRSQMEKRSYFILRGYIDDSGYRDHSPVMVLGGWITPVVNWLEFVPEWQAMLDMPLRLDYFKMNETANLDGQFDGWSDQRRDERVALAFKIIEQHAKFKVSCIIHLEPFYRIFNSDLVEKSARNPYYLAFCSIINDVAYHQRTHGIEEKIDFVFDDQVMEKGKIFDAWDKVKEKNSRSDTKDLIGSVPAFLDDKRFLPLQAADLIAWWIRKMVTDEPDGIKRLVFPWVPAKNIPGFQFNYNERDY